MILEAIVDAKDRTERAVGAGTATYWFACSCGYPRASMAMKAMTFGSHAILSYLWASFSQLRDTTLKFSPMKEPITKESHLQSAQRTGQSECDRILRTAREITLMITIPSVSSRCELTLANVCPPMMQFRTRNPCIEKTFRTLGMMDP